MLLTGPCLTHSHCCLRARVQRTLDSLNELTGGQRKDAAKVELLAWRNFNGITALHLAARHNRIEFVEKVGVLPPSPATMRRLHSAAQQAVRHAVATCVCVSVLTRSWNWNQGT